MNIKKGDIFEWRYKDEKKHGDYLNYWCCSRICIATDTHLVDMYWGSDGGSHGTVIFETAQRELELKFIANLDDLEKINDWEAVYYRPEDIVNLNHSNRPMNQVYRRKGTSRDRDTMYEYARRCRDRYHEIADSALSEVNRHEKLMQDLAMAQEIDLDKIYLQLPR